MKTSLDSRLPLPLYYQLKEIFDDKIQSGVWPVGQMIPTENELIRMYKVSRTTVREAITALVNEGKLQKKQGKGTSVCQQKMEERLGRLTGFTEEMESKGFVPGAFVLSMKEIVPKGQVKEVLLGDKEGVILFIERIRLANSEPIAIERSYWPQQFGKLFQGMDLSVIAFYKVLEDSGILLKYADETITAKSSSKTDAKLLGIKEKAPLLCMERISYSVYDEPIEYTFTDYRSDRYTYRVQLQK
ncbi:MAG: GntR family transcriptional regulator [Bacilli bacterium]|nr:GntR family transcriptional regulator [Bacilli bacterium]